MFRSYGCWLRSVIFRDHALVVHTYLLLFFPFPNGNNVRTFVDNLLKLRNKRHNSNLYQSVICISNLCMKVCNDQDKPMLRILFPPLLELRHRQVVYPNWTRDRLTIEAEAMEMLSPFWIPKSYADQFERRRDCCVIRVLIVHPRSQGLFGVGKRPWERGW